MDTPERSELFAGRGRQAFTAAPAAEGVLPPDIRIANALELIAAQLGAIARTLQHMEPRLAHQDASEAEKKALDLAKRLSAGGAAMSRAKIEG
ncbi:MAG: hypothetical protein WB816_12790 [Methylocystis sp.]